MFVVLMVETNKQANNEIWKNASKPKAVIQKQALLVAYPNLLTPKLILIHTPWCMVTIWSTFYGVI